MTRKNNKNNPSSQSLQDLRKMPLQASRSFWLLTAFRRYRDLLLPLGTRRRSLYDRAMSVRIVLAHEGLHGLMRRIHMRTRLASRYKNGANPILIYQMGKVGSTSVQLSLEQAFKNLWLNVPVHHYHVLNHLDEYEQTISRKWQNPDRALYRIQEGRILREFIENHPEIKWNLISLVRDPAARNVAAFFENLSGIIPNWKERVQAGALDIAGLQESFLAGEWIHFPPEDWFDNQLKPIFGIDVYSIPFPLERGYKIYEGSTRAKLLVIRLEDLDRVAGQAMYEFLGLEDFRIERHNTGDAKEYARIYQTFKQSPLPGEYVKNIYCTRFARHFYSDQELKQFSRRWLAK
jgi:hypothetical protein